MMVHAAGHLLLERTQTFETPFQGFRLRGFRLSVYMYRLRMLQHRLLDQGVEGTIARACQMQISSL